MLESLLSKLHEHAKLESPKECCGLGLLKGDIVEYYPCKNIAPEGFEEFIIDPQDYLKASLEGTIIAICHSHVNYDCEPSEADIANCNKGLVPWLIVDAKGNHKVLNPLSVSTPLVGRKFIHGVFDCLSIIEDYYAQELGIIIPPSYREPEWWNKGLNYYEDLYEEKGFVDSGGSLQKHDVILMKVGSPVANHAAIYLGEGRILHHIATRLSSIDLYKGFWPQATTKIIRHKSLC